MTEPTGFKKNDLRRAISAMRAEGLEPVKIAIGASGGIELWCADAPGVQVGQNEWDASLEKAPAA